MSKRSFIQLDQSILDQYSNPLKLGVGRFHNHEFTFLTPMYAVRRDELAGLNTKFWEGTSSTFPTAGSKVYFTSGFKTTKARIRELCKINDLVYTNDYTKADVFIIGSQCKAPSVSYGIEIKASYLYYRTFRSLSYVTSGDEEIRDHIKEEDLLGIYFDSPSWNWESRDISEGNRDLVSSELLGMYDRCIVDSIDVMNEEEFILKASGSVRQPITEETLETIVQLRQSYSDENYELAAQLLVNTDPHANKHLLWRLFNRCNLNWIANRNKDYQQWKEEAELEYLQDLDAETMIQRLANTGHLNKESFLYLEDFARQQIRVYNRDMYNIKVTLKEEWKQYLK